MSTSEPVGDRGVVRRQGVLDLSHLTTPEELATIHRIERVGTVVVPNSLAGAYAKIPTERVGSTIYVPDGANVRMHTGPLVVGGDGLGGPEDVLVITGVLVIVSPVTGPVPQRISVIGSVLAPSGSESALGPALGGGVGTVTYYRYVEGQDIKVLTGQVRLSGASLANSAGGRDDVLLAAGQVVLTGPIATVGYAQVVVAGQLIAPAASREVLEPRLQVQGQVVWARSDEARVFTDDTEVGPDFFRLLDQPVSLVLLGDLTITAGVTEAMLREKVTDIVLLGDVTAPAEVVPMLQVLAVDALGTIRASDGPGG
jgi:hypothetical protein